jgi:hypothetical protein
MSSQPPLPVTLPGLESHLWEAANILQGSPVDRSDWKPYILPLLFFKRVCRVPFVGRRPRWPSWKEAKHGSC